MEPPRLRRAAPRRAASSARPAALSPLQFTAPNRQLLRSAPARSAPAGREARARGPLRLGGLALRRSRQRSATARCRGRVEWDRFEKELERGEISNDWEKILMQCL